MNIAVLADTHRNYPLAVRALDTLVGLDQVIHLGDLADDAEIIGEMSGIKMTILSGNCDIPRKYPDLLTMTAGGKTLLMTHGDRFHVKVGLERLSRRAREENADIVLYGHTHVPCIQEINGILFINPGTLIKSTSNPTLAVLHIAAGHQAAELVSITSILNLSFPQKQDFHANR